MKRLCTFFLCLVCHSLISGTALAQLVFTEDFDYPAGDSLKQHGWVMTGSVSSYSYVNSVSVVAPGLECPGYSGSGIGNAAGLASTGQDICKSFQTPVSGGSAYAFMMVRVSAARTTGDYFFHLIGGAPTSSAFAPKLSVKSNGGRLAFGISKRANASSAVYTGFTYGLDTTYLVVLKYTFVPDATTNDEVSLYVFEPSAFPGSEPAVATVGPVTESSGADVDSLWYCALRQGSSSSAPTLVVDGIRIATAWQTELPIQISSFHGVLEDAATVTLSWVTQSEFDNYGFEVQRSDSATGGFAAISGLIPGHNTTTEPHSYSFTDHGVPAGRWFYRLKSISMDQSVSYSEVLEIANVTSVDRTTDAPNGFVLMQNYPNPFNPTTVVSSQLAVVSNVRIVIYDLLGREVATLVNERRAPGIYHDTFDGTGLASGVYIYRLTAGLPVRQAGLPAGQAGTFVQAKSMLLLK
jgi:hypothetical protein